MVQAIFTQGIDVVTAHGLTQWDYGQTLEIHGLNDLPATFQVHFACKRIDEAIVRLATTTNGVGSVVIPDKMLEQDTDLRAWIYIVGTDTGETIKLIQLPIQPRTKPQDFISVVTPSQQTMLEEFMADINESLETSNVTVTQHIANKSNPHEVTLEQVVGESAVPVANGGTGATDAETARTNLEITPSKIGAEPKITKLPISKGGTGAGTAEEARTNLEITPSNIGAEPTIETLELGRGGTGATTAAGAREKLGVTPANIGAEPTISTLPVTKGGTGAATAATARSNLGITPANINAVSKSGDTMTGQLNATRIRVAGDNNYPTYEFKANSQTSYGAMIQTGSVNTIGFYEYPKEFDGQSTRYYEGYLLPDPSTGLTANKNYKILTTKVPVSVAQGGTGATTAAGARANLGIPDIQVGTATVGTSGATITFPRAFLGVPTVTANGSAQTSIRVYNITKTECTLVSGISDNAVQWQAIYVP